MTIFANKDASVKQGIYLGENTVFNNFLLFPLLINNHTTAAENLSFGQDLDENPLPIIIVSDRSC